MSLAVRRAFDETFGAAFAFAVAEIAILAVRCRCSVVEEGKRCFEVELACESERSVGCLGAGSGNFVT